MRWTPVRRVARESVSWRGFLSYWSSGNSFARSMSGPRRKVQLWPIIQGVRETSKLATTYLIETLSPTASWRTQQRQWTKRQMRQCPVGDGRVVASEVELGGPFGGPEDAIGMRKPHAAKDDAAIAGRAGCFERRRLRRLLRRHCSGVRCRQ